MPAVAKHNEIESGQMLSIDLQGTRVALAHVDSAYYAFSDNCPHDHARLSSGQLDGLVVICPGDGSRFEITSGRVIQGPATTRVRTYRVQRDGDELRI
jgi:nitrite reductase/ring-hydroxylating ferredoxin subunit